MDADARSIKIHTEAEFEGMRRAGQLAAKTLDYITEFVVPGVATEKLDQLCAEFVSDHGAVSAPLNYRGYPKSACISVNHVVCHGIPGDKVLNGVISLTLMSRPCWMDGTVTPAACFLSVMLASKRVDWWTSPMRQ